MYFLFIFNFYIMHYMYSLLILLINLIFFKKSVYFQLFILNTKRGFNIYVFQKYGTVILKIRYRYIKNTVPLY
jgi:hypothetical protein